MRVRGVELKTFSSYIFVIVCVNGSFCLGFVMNCVGICVQLVWSGRVQLAERLRDVVIPVIAVFCPISPELL